MLPSASNAGSSVITLSVIPTNAKVSPRSAAKSSRRTTGSSGLRAVRMKAHQERPRRPGLASRTAVRSEMLSRHDRDAEHDVRDGRVLEAVRVDELVDALRRSRTPHRGRTARARRRTPRSSARSRGRTGAARRRDEPTASRPGTAAPGCPCRRRSGSTPRASTRRRSARTRRTSRSRSRGSRRTRRRSPCGFPPACRRRLPGTSFRRPRRPSSARARSRCRRRARVGVHPVRW